MNKNFSTKLITFLAIVALVSIGSYAFAGGGRGYGDRGDCPGYGQRGYGYHGDGQRGYGHHGDGQRGYGHHGDGQRGYGRHGYGQRGYGGEGKDYSDRGYGGDLTQKEFESLEMEREAFMKDTRKLRENIHDKRVDLRRELAGENPDAKKAGNLQKEISGLRAELDQKKIGHLVKMRKIAPSAGRGWRGGYGSRGGGQSWE